MSEELLAELCCVCNIKYPNERSKSYIFGKTHQKDIRSTVKHKYSKPVSKLLCDACLSKYFVQTKTKSKFLEVTDFLIIKDSTQVIYNLRNSDDIEFINSSIYKENISVQIVESTLNMNCQSDVFTDSEFVIQNSSVKNDNVTQLLLDNCNNIEEEIKVSSDRLDFPLYSSGIEDPVEYLFQDMTSIKTYTCHICCKQIVNKSRFYLHLQRHESKPRLTKVHSCSFCKMAFKNLENAEIHINDKDCIHDAKVLNEKLTENNTKLTNIGVIVVEIDRVFRCEYCEKVYCDDTSLLYHLNVHKNNPLPYCCKLCGTSFNKYSRYIFHKNAHKMPRKHSRFTEILDFDFQIDKFPVVKMFLCEICRKSFFDRAYFIDHKKQSHHSALSEKKCKICNVVFNNRWMLSRHRKKKHSNLYGNNSDRRNFIQDQPSYFCIECGDSFLRPENLRNHKRLVHQIKIKLPCPHCGKEYIRSDDLHRHIKIHTDDRPFLCEICLKKFRNKGSFNEHLRIHSDERPYSCDICGMTFKRARAVKSHRLIHSKKRIYKCPHCQQFFNCSSDIKSHISKFHSDSKEAKNENENILNLNEIFSLSNFEQENFINIDDIHIKSFDTNNLTEDQSNMTNDNSLAIEKQPDFVLVDEQQISDASYFISYGNEIFDQMSEGDFLIFNESGDNDAIWKNLEISEDTLVCTFTDD